MEIRQLLLQTLDQRCARNPNDSLRALARDLSMSPQNLSRILNGQRGVSRKLGVGLAEKLSLNEREKEMLLLSIDAEFSRSQKCRVLAGQKLNHHHDHQKTDFSAESFSVIAEWYHLPLLSLIQMKNKILSTSEMAKRLNISEQQVQGALRKLVSLSLLKKEGSRYVSQIHVSVRPKETSEAVQKYHEQMLERSKDAIFMQSMQERDLSSLVLPVDPDEMIEAKAMIQKFRKEFEARFSNAATRKAEIYALGVQFFRLTQPVPKKRRRRG